MKERLPSCSSLVGTSTKKSRLTAAVALVEAGKYHSERGLVTPSRERLSEEETTTSRVPFKAGRCVQRRTWKARLRGFDAKGDARRLFASRTRPPAEVSIRRPSALGQVYFSAFFFVFIINDTNNTFGWLLTVGSCLMQENRKIH